MGEGCTSLRERQETDLLQASTTKEAWRTPRPAGALVALQHANKNASRGVHTVLQAASDRSRGARCVWAKGVANCSKYDAPLLCAVLGLIETFWIS